MPQHPPQLSDAQLIRAIRAGDEAAFRELVQRYQGPCYGCALGITRRPSDAADVAQEAFIRLYRNIEQFDPERPLKPYLLTIVANCSRTLLARRQRQPATAGEPEPLERLADPGTTPQTRLLRSERKRAVRKLVEELPETLRDVCSLFYLSNCSCREVAMILNMNEGAVRTALHRARKQLMRSGAAEWRNLT